MDDLDQARSGGRDLDRSRSSLLTALVMTGLLTAFAAAIRLPVPGWLLMAAAGAVVGAVCAMEQDANAPLVAIACVSGAAAGGIVGGTIAVCPLCDAETVASVRLATFVMVLGGLVVFGGLCGAAGGLAAGLLVREFRQPPPSDEGTTPDRPPGADGRHATDGEGPSEKADIDRPQDPAGQDRPLPEARSSPRSLGDDSHATGAL